MMDREPSCGSLVDLLRLRARLEGDRRAKSFLSADDSGAVHRTYGELDRTARSIAEHLASSSEPGDRALLLFPPGLEFTEAFFGCLYGGLVAVPAPPPDPRRLERTLPRVLSILEDCAPAFILTTEGTLPALGAAAETAPVLSEIPWVATDSLPVRGDEEATWEGPRAGPETLAYLQYTSGSTAAPKGVRSTHAHILRNCRYLEEGLGYDRDSVQLSWVPDFHDDGLIQGVVLSIFTGFLGLRMAPLAVARRPLAWLRAITEHRVTHSGGPNFVYELAAERVRGKDRQGLDLSTWRVAYNAAEPIRPSTLAKFHEAFSPHGFRWETFYPAFGMAETTLIISAKPHGQGPLLLPFDAEALELHGQAREVPPSPAAKTLVGCGTPLGGARFEIVDPESSRPRGQGEVGELWISDPCVADGYWGGGDATSETFEARLAQRESGSFLRTGDLAFLHRGQVFIAGRLKDLIILDGRNIYPQDVELASEGAHGSLRRGCAAAFSVEAQGQERLVVVQEARPDLSPETAAEARGAVRQAVAQALDAEVWEVVLIAPGTLPKTSSGKIQRQACRALYSQGRLEVPAPAQSPREAVGSGEGKSPGDRDPSPPASGAVEMTASEITAWLRRRLARRLGCAAREVDPRQPFSRWGLGSTALVGLVGELEERIGRSLSETFLWQHPTIEGVSRALTGGGGMDGSAPPEGGRRGSAGDLPGAEPRHREPVAIVGIGCRFPGASSPRAFWRLLRDGIDAVGEVPADRWPVEEFYHPDPRTPGKMNSRWGGFLQGVDGFDPHFFGISPREAERMDPQQRLLLEVTWEALEDAGIPPRSLAGSATGVWVGIGMSDYGRWLFEEGALSDAYAGTGGALSIAANRLSYSLDLRGPSMAVDSACSASLVAVDRACRSLWRGETELALAAGVNLLLAPEVTVNFSQAGFLASDGRSKAFDARADGYVRSEGAGVVVLKPLSRARAAGDPIYAVVRGGAVNQDGRSNGLTAPNPRAQERLIADACRDAGVEPSAVQAVEAHGTGTALGDPIEARALGTVLGAGRAPAAPCSLGSVKTNLGHLETAAGIAGLIKMALCLHHRRLVPSLHYEEGNPRIDFEALGLAVQTEEAPWEGGGEPRLAGVSSFGFGGTNAHVVLAEAPEMPEAPEAPGARSSGEGLSRDELVLLTAADPRALSQRARDLRAGLAAIGGRPRPAAADGGVGEGEPLRDLAWTTARRLSHLDHRLAIATGDLGELDEALAALEAGDELKDLSRGQRPFDGPSPSAFVFSGQGGQWPAMGRELYASEAVFREAVDAAAAALAPHVDWDPVAELLAPQERSRLSEIDVVQPLLFALQVALAALWRAWGVEPRAVVGHSLGEVAAATVAGALSLEEGARIICHRSQLMRMTSGGGAMLAVEMEAPALEALLEASGGRAEIAVLNGPESVAVSGEVEAVEALRTALEERGVFCRRVRVDVAAHGPQMDKLLEPLGRLLDGLAPEAGELEFFSTVEGGAVSGRTLDATYWQRNLRQPVRFAEAVAGALEAGIRTFVEIGPHPLLTRALKRIGEARNEEVLAVASVRRDEGERRQMLRGLGALFCHGVEPRWPAVAPAAGRVTPLPTYPWQRRRFWMERQGGSPPPGRRQNGASPGAVHPLLGRRLDSAHRRETLWQGALEEPGLRFLDSHRLDGVMVLPGTAFLEMASVAGGALADVELSRPLWIPDEALAAGEIEVQTVVLEDGEDGEAPRRRFEIHSRRGRGPWSLHCSGRYAAAPSAAATEALDTGELRARLGPAVDGEAFYRGLADSGYGYGPRHRRVRRLWSGDAEVLVELEAGETDGPWSLHPATLDSAWQGLAALLPDSGQRWLPSRVGGFERTSASGEPAWACIRASEISRARIEARVDLHDRGGVLLARSEGLELRRSLLEAPLGAGSREPGVFTVAWRESPLPGTPGDLPPGPATWLILGAGDGVAKALAAEVEGRGDHPRLLAPEALGKGPEAGAEALLEVLAETRGGALPPLRHVVTLGPGDAPAGSPDPSGEVHRILWHQLNLLGALATAAGDPTARLWVVTRGAVSVPGETLPKGLGSLPQGALQSLAGVLAHEHPELFGGVVDLEDGKDGAKACPALVREIVTSAKGERIALRRGRRYVARLRRAAAAELAPPVSPAAGRRIREDRGYLITGGFGGLGLEVARWLAGRGARHLALLGRRIPKDGHPARELLAELEADGCKIYPLSADVADHEALGAALELYAGPPWAGVVHAAGHVDDARLLDTDGSRLAAVLAPKVAGSWNLHRRLEATPLDFFWLFSSAAGVLGNPGQGAYAAANGFLGALAQLRRALGLPAKTLHWGPWGEVGFVARQGAELGQRLEAQGFSLLPPPAALDALGRLAESTLTEPVILAAAWERLRRSGSPLGLSPLLQELLPASPPEGEAESSPGLVGEDPTERLRRAAPEDRGPLLETFLRGRLGKVLKAPAGSFQGEVPLTAHGLDSLVAVEVQRALEGDLGVRVPLAWLLQGESLEGLRDRLLEALPSAPGDGSRRRPEGKLESAPAPDLSSAVETMSPGEAELLLDRLDDMPAEEVERLLARMENLEVAL